MVWLYWFLGFATYTAIGGLVVRVADRLWDKEDDLPIEAVIFVFMFWPAFVALVPIGVTVWLVAPNLFKDRDTVRGPHMFPPPPPSPSPLTRKKVEND